VDTWGKCGGTCHSRGEEIESKECNKHACESNYRGASLACTSDSPFQPCFNKAESVAEQLKNLDPLKQLNLAAYLASNAYNDKGLPPKDIHGRQFIAHIKENFDGMVWKGFAEAHVYILGDLCYVAIRGSDGGFGEKGGLADFLKGDFSAINPPVKCTDESRHCEDWHSVHHISRGMKLYYDDLRPRILNWCGSSRTIVSAGHSLGWAVHVDPRV